MTALPPHIESLHAVSGRYKAIFCDVWGVLHNGVAAFPKACAALMKARENGIAVVLITNAPRPAPDVAAQMRSLGVPDEAWDRLVTSGDVSRDLIADGPRKVFHLGPDRDLSIYDGLDVELVEEFEAASVVCTGLFDDETETPDDYREMLMRLRSRNLPFICANPDIVVERGDRLIWCSGALARDFAQMGGRALISGKPHAPIYRAAMKAAGEALGHESVLAETLAIGDGMLTDIKGAADFGIDALYVTGGIHARDYDNGAGGFDPVRLAGFLDKQGFRPVSVIERLA